MNTSEIINACEKFLSDHDLESFKLLYHHYYKSLCFFASEYTKEESLSEDIVQDVFTQVWEKGLELGGASKLQGYLYAMVRNKCLNQIRSLGHLQKYQAHETPIEDWESDESIRIVKAEVYREIMASIEQLPARAREVFELSYLTQLREQEIADRLGISVNSVKTHKKRARSILKDELKHLFDLLIILRL
ncbi:RNA polymerase sigma-70 factor [Carboxylicivirga sp. RSCT41]|uniref:RNA polymerase sigma-70 factor n=1 Tax=Carboxylicivirga agarovorans TaxID=3417570 RepID=UPI003D32D482